VFSWKSLFSKSTRISCREHICGMQGILLALKSIQNAFKQHAIEIHELFIQGNDVYNTNSEVAFIAENYLKANYFYRLCYFRKE
jgi:hypothetical protein